MQKFTCSNFRGSYFHVLVVGRENRENFPLYGSLLYNPSHTSTQPDTDLSWDRQWRESLEEMMKGLPEEVGTKLPEEVETRLSEEVGTSLPEEVGTSLPEEVGTRLPEEVERELLRGE